MDTHENFKNAALKVMESKKNKIFEFACVTGQCKKNVSQNSLENKKIKSIII
jgi:hypothetical protein